MVNTHYATTGVIGARLGTPTSEAEFEVGTELIGNDGTKWLYVQCDSTSAITQYDCVAVDENLKAYPLTKARADDGFTVGLAQSAFTVAYYGFIALKGAKGLNLRVAASCAADVALYTTATAGVLDDASTNQTKIDGVVATTAGSAGGVTSVEVIATHPKSTTF